MEAQSGTGDTAEHKGEAAAKLRSLEATLKGPQDLNVEGDQAELKAEIAELQIGVQVPSGLGGRLEATEAALAE